MNTPTREQFDAMSDQEFEAWWEARVEAAQAEATSEDEVQAVCDQRDAAWAERFAS